MFPDLSRPDQFVALVELCASSDFFTVAGASRENIYAAEPRPRSCYELFDWLMNRIAVREGKPYWLQKVSPIVAGDVLRFFDAAIVVTIRRSMLDTLRSTRRLRLDGGSGRASVSRLAAGYIYQEKLLDQVGRRHNAHATTYEALRNDTNGVVKRLCEEIGLPFEAGMTNVAFKPNTSFKSSEAGRETALSPVDIRLAEFVAVVARVLPAPMLGLLRSQWGPAPLHVIQGTFAGLRARHGVE